MEVRLAVISLAAVVSSLPVVSSDTKDSTGLVGTSPALLLGSTQLPLQFWANPRKSALKPRKRDLHEPTLMALLGPDFDSRWMKKSRPQSPTNSDIDNVEDDDDRKAVHTLRGYLNSSGSGPNIEPLQLPSELPSEYRELVKTWLIRRATCPIRFVWDNLGPYFWPKWIRRGECIRGNSSSCSWPPGMTCVPGGARNLHVLRWHCRLRKHQGKGRKKSENQVWSNGEVSTTTDGVNSKGRRKKRRKYRCFWIKVPYPVPEDCVCACAEKDIDSEEPEPTEDR
ncbi:noggin-like isoform X2 [Lycorma delicatula]|uniref:noggin-like isoform X2 n=1 Tax=Lycorma delicatula TaxID=130591 RepID=UPI003F5167CD